MPLTAIVQANWEMKATGTVSTEADKRTGWRCQAKSGSDSLYTYLVWLSFCPGQRAEIAALSVDNSRH